VVWARWMQRNPGRLPPLRESGIRWEPEKFPGWEEWAPPPLVYARGFGDCDDIVLWRLAELLAAGEKAHPQVLRDWQDGVRYHVAIRRADGSEEDPSTWFLQEDPHG